MNKATAVAHSNLAFVKYWGKKDHELNIPLNGSISMNLSDAKTITTVEFDDDLDADVVEVAGETIDMTSRPGRRVHYHLNRLRHVAGTTALARVTTKNTFPSGTGFASSASGFAALTLAVAAALNLDLPEKDLSILARQGSGSACRSIPAGFVEWHAGNDTDDSYAESIAAADHWDIVDVAVIVTETEKTVSSSLGHKLALNSAFWGVRKPIVEARLGRVRDAILARDFTTFGREMEVEALEMHAIALTSAHETGSGWQSGVFYWETATLELIKAIQNWRAEGLDAYFTLDAGPTVHILCPRDQQDAVQAAVESLRGGRNWSMLVNAPAPGAYLVSE